MGDCTAILLGAGKSSRLGFDKILSPLAGKPVLLYSLEAFLQAPSISRIIITTRADVADAVRSLIAPFSSKPITVILGGKERQDSVLAGLEEAGTQTPYVAIHDAARPLLSPEEIEAVLDVCRKSGAAIRALRTTDTVKRADANAIVTETLNRNELWLMKTPQIFTSSTILPAYRKIAAEGVSITDDAAAAEYAGHRVTLVDTGHINLKITLPSDWTMAEALLSHTSSHELRDRLHQLANLLGPLVGYLPLMKKYGGTNPKFLDYFDKCSIGTRQFQEKLKELQDWVRSREHQEKD